MKKSLIAVPAALSAALPLSYAAAKAVKIKAKPVNERPAAPFTAADAEKYARSLSEMIKVPTVSVKEGGDKAIFYELQAVMAQQFPLIFEKLEKIDLDGNLLLRWKGKDPSKKPLLLMGHQDVVPADENNWVHAPFSGDIEDGKVHGRGAMDCKCTVCAEMWAVEELLERGFTPERDVYLASSTNEEISGGGAQKIVKYFADNNIRLAAAMDEGGAIVDGIMPGMDTLCAAVGICEKGSANIKFTAKSNGGHSSTPPKNDPFTRLAAFITDVEKHDPFKAKLTPPVLGMFDHVAPYLPFPLRMLLGNMNIFGPLVKTAMPVVSPMAKAFLKTSYVFTMAQGSGAPNVIPGEAYVIANIRPSLTQDLDTCFDILKKIAAKYDVEAELLFGNSASAAVPLDSGELAYVGQCVDKCYPGYCFTPYMQTGGTDCRYFESVCDNCLRFTPIAMDSQQLAAMHGANENIGVDAVAAGVKFYEYWLEHHE